MAQSPRATRPLSPVAATTSATKRAQARRGEHLARSFRGVGRVEFQRDAARGRGTTANLAKIA
jgi:hypothetical protein